MPIDRRAALALTARYVKGRELVASQELFLFQPPDWPSPRIPERRIARGESHVDVPGNQR